MRYLILFLALSFAPLKAEDNKVIACDNGVELLGWTLGFISQAEQSIEFLPVSVVD